MLIRDFRVADAAAVNALAAAAFEQYRGAYSDWQAFARGVGAMASLANGAELIVAEAGGHIAGAVAYYPPHSQPRADFFEPGWSIVRMLVVDLAQRGSGLGRALTERCIKRARRDKAPFIGLHTGNVMEVALALYLKLGFRLIRPAPDCYGVAYGVYALEL